MAKEEQKKTDTKKAAPAASGEVKKPRKKAGTGGNITAEISAVGETKISPKVVSRLQLKYKNEIIEKLRKELGLENTMEIPRLKKIVLNCGVKEAVTNPKSIDSTFNDLMIISGQKPVIRRAKKAIAAFKVRQGNPVAVSVTLRRARMYEFLDRLINVALPRVRDFKGISPRSFDGRGNYSLGLKEQIIFPEISYDKVDQIRGFTVTIETSARKNEDARALLTHFGMPFRK